MRITRQNLTQQRPLAPVPQFTQDALFTGVANPPLLDSSDLVVAIGLVVCLISWLLGRTVFHAVGLSGTAAGYVLGYALGGILQRFAIYFSVPFWLAAWVFAYFRQESRVQFDRYRLLSCLPFVCYVLMHWLVSDPLHADESFEYLLGTAPSYCWPCAYASAGDAICSGSAW